MQAGRDRIALAAALALCASPALATGPFSDSVAGGPDPWHTLAPGVQSASVADLGGDPSWAARVLLFDPQRARLSVQFDPARPTLAQWRARFPDALALADGSFYSTDGLLGEVRPTCDLVLAGKQVRGAGCRRQDALFFGAIRAPPLAGGHSSLAAPSQSTSAVSASAVTAATTTRPCAVTASSPNGPRLLAPADFRAAEWTEALKSFPALVHGCAVACAGQHYCQDRSRTAALAQLRDGKLVLFASQWPAVRREVGRFLAETLGAVEAVNLDGGPEATLALRGEDPGDSIGTAGTGLPLVLVLLPR